MNFDWFNQLIKKFVDEYSQKHGTATAWQEPLLGAALADNPAFLGLKQIVGPNHALPQDLLPDAQSVLAYFIPFTAEIIKSNIPDQEASRVWALAYIETNQLIIDLNQHIYEQLAKVGYTCSRIPPTHNFDKVKLISDWSHRHVAYIAGLGTFGYNNMLITSQGCCGRVGSVVTNVKLEPTPLLEGEYCLYKKAGICQACVKRCVNQALTEDGFNRQRCYQMCLLNEELHSAVGKADVCGKCLVGIPCSAKIPGNNK